MIINDAITSVYSVIAVWIPVTVVPRSFATVAIAVFITVVSRAMTNCPAASVISTIPAAPAAFAVPAPTADVPSNLRVGTHPYRWSWQSSGSQGWLINECLGVRGASRHGTRLAVGVAVADVAPVREPRHEVRLTSLKAYREHRRVSVQTIPERRIIPSG